MEEGKNEIMELRQMIEGCFERQNKLIARLEMELEALSNFNGKQMLDSRDMRLQLKVCDRTLIRWRMSGKLPSFKISGTAPPAAIHAFLTFLPAAFSGAFRVPFCALLSISANRAPASPSHVCRFLLATETWVCTVPEDIR